MKVILLHAFPLDESMWEPQREVLTGHDAVAPRLYGRGDSIDAWAGQLLDEIEGELVAVGASMGGYCAYALARHAPERVAGMLVVGARPGPDSAERRAVRDSTIALLAEEGLGVFVSAAPFETPPGLTAGGLIEASRALRDRPDATEVVAAFCGPFTLVVGDRDELLDVEEARGIAASAPHGSLEVVDGAGHIVSQDAPQRFNALLDRFLQQWT